VQVLALIDHGEQAEQVGSAVIEGGDEFRELVEGAQRQRGRDEWDQDGVGSVRTFSETGADRGSSKRKRPTGRSPQVDRCRLPADRRLAYLDLLHGSSNVDGLRPMLTLTPSHGLRG
jgi:hypothetical protein